MSSHTEERRLFSDFLKRRGLKTTRERTALFDEIFSTHRHFDAEDLVLRMRERGAKISRATVYRTLQWMVDAGVARKVDFGEGRFRFEHSYRHPRHFHLICKSCNRSSEFLSSDIEGLIEEIAAARGFAARQSVLQIYGTCEECRTGRPAPVDGGTTELLFARDALRIAIATERRGLDFYARAANAATDPRGRSVFQRLGLPSPSSISKWDSPGWGCSRGHRPSSSRLLFTSAIASATRSSA